jgi:hypothetical protein
MSVSDMRDGANPDIASLIPGYGCSQTARMKNEKALRKGRLFCKVNVWACGKIKMLRSD